MDVAAALKVIQFIEFTSGFVLDCLSLIYIHDLLFELNSEIKPRFFIIAALNCVWLCKN